MNELQIFNNSKYGEMRTTEIDGATWFCLADICRPLGIAAYDCKKRLNSGGTVTIRTPTNSGIQGMIFVNESNFYKAVFQSKKPEAEEFTDWVTSEVLPSLRKHGTYTVQPVTQAELMLQQAQIIVAMERRIDTVETMLLDVGSKAEQAAAKLDTAIKIYSKPNADHWVEDMNAAIAELSGETAGKQMALRGRLYAELERTAGHTSIDARLTRLKSRMKKGGMTRKECEKLTKLDAIGKDTKLRAIFESIIKRYQAISA